MAAVELVRHRAAICGYVRDASSGAGIGSATVALVGTAVQQTQTGADGFYYVLDLADGLYALSAAAPTLGTRYGTVSVTGVLVASDAQGRPIFDPKGNLDLSPTRLTGTVRRSDTLAPIAHADVRLRASRVQTKSNTVGIYALSAVEAGTQTLEVSARGFTAVSQTVSLAAGQDSVVDIDLTPS
jgi:hypothetical protein